jgi:hypothetical protein
MQIAHLLPRLGGAAGDHEARVACPPARDAGDALVLGDLQEPRQVGVGLRPQRVLGVHLQHQVHSALEVEAEIDFLFRRIGQQHGGGGDRQDQQPAPEQIPFHE